MTNKQGNNKKYQTCKSRKNLCFSFFFFWFIYFFVFTFIFLPLFLFLSYFTSFSWLNASPGLQGEKGGVTKSGGIYKYLQIYTSYILSISQGCQRFETSVFFSEKINISTTGGSRVGFFQPDTNHP